MQKKDILGNEWMSKSFIFSSSMKKLDGEYEGYSSLKCFLNGSRELYVTDSGERQCLTRKGYKWLTYLPMNESWALMTFYNPKNEIVRWYFDISKRNFTDEKGMPCREDLFLDLIILPDGRTITKDADDLQEALDKGEITSDDYHYAYTVHNQILNSKWNDVALLTKLSNKLLFEYS